MTEHVRRPCETQNSNMQDVAILGQAVDIIQFVVT